MSTGTADHSSLPQEAGEEHLAVNLDHSSVIIAICLTGKTLGVACYDEMENAILIDNIYFTIEDSEDIIYRLKAYLSPTLFLLHPNIISNKGLMELILQNIDDVESKYLYKVLRTQYWSEKTNRSLIYNSLCIRDTNFDISKSQLHLALSSAGDADNSSLTQALGALLRHLQDTIFNLHDGKVIVSTIKEIPSSRLLRIDNNSLAALGIISEDFHPNWLKGKGRSKEGFSMFSLLDRTSSLPGRNRLRDWMARPLCDLHAISKRQQAVALMARIDQTDFIQTLSGHLKHLHDLPRLLMRIKKVEANYLDWCRLHTSLETIIDIILYLQDCEQREYNEESGSRNTLTNVCGDFDVAPLHRARVLLQNWIDFDQSIEEKDVVIVQGKDSLLDSKRDLFQNLERYLTQAAKAILSLTPEIPSLSVEYVPQVGYLVVIPDQYVSILTQNYHVDRSSVGSSDNNSINHGDGRGHENTAEITFVFTFSHNGNHYFKHQIVAELDESIGDVRSDIVDRQRFILLQIEEKILDLETIILEAASGMATLDALMALGKVARECNLVLPQLVEEQVVVIKNGRHLLQELTVDNFVSNDTLLTPEKNVFLLSGANSSGKSVYLKQVGIIVYLAHIGSFVPAEHAIIGLTDRIMTRISSLETAARPLSAFAIDLSQISKMLKHRTSHSLCLIDEFGKGTNPMDGMALLASVIEDMTVVKSKAIFVLHFTEILTDQAISHQAMKSINCFQMESIEEQEEDDSYKSVVPLFKLRFGVGDSSQGIACARKMSINEKIIERSLQIKGCIVDQKEVHPITGYSEEDIENPQHRELLQIFFEVDDWTTVGTHKLDRMRQLIESDKNA